MAESLKLETAETRPVSKLQKQVHPQLIEKVFLANKLLFTMLVTNWNSLFDSLLKGANKWKKIKVP